MLSVDPPGLTDAAGQVEASAGVLAGLDVAGPFSGVSDALAGSRTSQSCLWLSTRLGAAVQVYAEGLEALAGAARRSAADFSGTDPRSRFGVRAGRPMNTPRARSARLARSRRGVTRTAPDVWRVPANGDRG